MLALQCCFLFSLTILEEKQAWRELQLDVSMRFHLLLVVISIIFIETAKYILGTEMCIYVLTMPFEILLL